MTDVGFPVSDLTETVAVAVTAAGVANADFVFARHSSEGWNPAPWNHHGFQLSLE